MPHIPDEYWNAIVQCDPLYNDSFIYAVKTTGIYCKPSCKSRAPRRENVHIFKNAYMAKEEGFRPCKRCKPDGAILPAEEWVGQIRDWIDENYHEYITLEGLAVLFNGSPFHLQRQFKQLQGMSPNEYIQKVRLEKAVKLLEEDKRKVKDISEAVGFLNTPYFITLFKKRYGCTPAAYRKKGGEKQ